MVRNSTASRGFTLIEVVFALGLLAGAAGALAQLLLASGAAGRDTRHADLASVLAQQRMEQLRSLAWGYDADGTAREDLTSSLAWPGLPDGAGPGIGVSPPDALERDTPGFVDYLDATGKAVDAAVRPSSVAFIRRWLVAGCADGPGDALVLRVLVIRREARADPVPTRSRGAAVLTTLKTRRTW